MGQSMTPIGVCCQRAHDLSGRSGLLSLPVARNSYVSSEALNLGLNCAGTMINDTPRSFAYYYGRFGSTDCEIAIGSVVGEPGEETLAWALCVDEPGRYRPAYGRNGRQVLGTFKSPAEALATLQEDLVDAFGRLEGALVERGGSRTLT